MTAHLDDAAARMRLCLVLSCLVRERKIQRSTLLSWLERVAEHGRDAFTAELAERFRLDLDTLSKKADVYIRRGIEACSLVDSIYPKRLRQSGSCPFALYYRTQHAPSIWNHPKAVTIIGTRNPSLYGKTVTRTLTADLADRGVLIISGLARGIDGLAHRVALNHGGLTLAVIAQGPDRAYPPEHKELMDEISEKGAVLSEHPPGTPPRRSYFPARNRILSGLADCVAVMEASRRSGALITAGFAADQGRDVFAVPGSILLGKSDGCHQLIRDGAGLVTSSRDILDALTIDSLPLVRAASEDAVQHLSQDDIDRFRHIAGSDWSLEAIAEAFNWPLQKTAVWLGIQEMAGYIARDRGRYSLTGSAYFCI